MLAGWLAKRQSRAADKALKTAIAHSVQDWFLLEIEEWPHPKWAKVSFSAMNSSIDRSKGLSGVSHKDRIDLFVTVIVQEGPLTRSELFAALGEQEHPVQPQTTATLDRLYGPMWRNETEQGS